MSTPVRSTRPICADAAARSSKQRRLALGHRAESGEQGEQGSRLDEPGDRLGQVHQCSGSAFVRSPVDEQPDRLDVTAALDERRGEPARNCGVDGDRRKCVGGDEIDPPCGLAPDEYAGREDPIEEAGAPEPSEESDVDPGGAGQEADQPGVVGVEQLQRNGAHRSQRPSGDRDDVGLRFEAGLGDRGGDDLDAAVDRFDELCGLARAEVRTLCDELRKRDPERRRVEDQAVDEMGDVVDGIGQNPSRHDQSSVGGSVLDELDEPLDIDRFEQVGVVDDDGGIRHVRLVGDRPELATEPNRPGRCRLAQQPGLAEPRGRLDHYERGRGGVSEPCEQCRSWKTHRSSDQSVVVVLWTVVVGCLPPNALAVVPASPARVTTSVPDSATVARQRRLRPRPGHRC